MWVRCDSDAGYANLSTADKIYPTGNGAGAYVIYATWGSTSAQLDTGATYATEADAQAAIRAVTLGVYLADVL